MCAKLRKKGRFCELRGKIRRRISRGRMMTLADAGEDPVVGIRLENEERRAQSNGMVPIE